MNKEQQEKKELLFSLCYARLDEKDIQVARRWRDSDADAPIWVLMIAGANPFKLPAVQELAREELAHELFGTDSEV